MKQVSPHFIEYGGFVLEAGGSTCHACYLSFIELYNLSVLNRLARLFYSPSFEDWTYNFCRVNWLVF